MKILEHFPEKYLKNTIVTIGTFDGLHLGHQKILNQMKKYAVMNRLKSVVISFKNHPRKVINPDFDLKLLTTVDERLPMFEKFFLNYLILLEFTKEIAEMSAAEFIDLLMKHLDIKMFLVGYDNHFGKNRQADADFLTKMSFKYNFDVVEINPLLVNNEEVSSTKIRKALLDGDIKKANMFLGYKYFITGEVTEGKKIGAKMGFPTANLKVPKEKLIPKNGVYATFVTIDNAMYWSMTNIGFKPTLNSENQQVIETHIFDFNQNIYGKKIKIHFVRRIRDEIKFASVEELARQLHKDKETVKEILIETN